MTAAGPAAEGLRQRKARQTWTAINRAARRLALERSVDDISVQEIAERADVSVRTVFNYFPSKEDAVLGVRDLPPPPVSVARFLAAPGPLLDDVVALAFDSLRENWGGFTETASAAAELGELLEKNAKLVQRIAKAGERFEGQIVEVVLRRVDDRLQAKVAVAVAGRLCGLAVEQWVRGGAGPGGRETLEEIVAAFRRSL
ncbi:MAG: TetR/AcrR family transcriptional regulator [Segniliparus sp.]|uniref:TetR/AcrR family transcriptional regulator n=1 Tax=Segniliparus sp. TaxID=2804064 RepID=UPI003F33DC1D